MCVPVAVGIEGWLGVSDSSMAPEPYGALAMRRAIDAMRSSMAADGEMRLIRTIPHALDTDKDRVRNLTAVNRSLASIVAHQGDAITALVEALAAMGVSAPRDDR